MSMIFVGDLEVSCQIVGEQAAPAVMLLHGWPDDASTWAGVLPPLVAAGRRCIVPSLRGFAETRFIDPAAPRTANSGMLAIDAIGLLDALEIERAAIVGHDWGSNIAEALAVGWPQRIERIAMLSTPPRLGGMPTPPFWHAQLEWYHWFMATERGAQAVRGDRRGFARCHWDNWSPAGWYDEATFAAVATAWDNPDWVDVTLHSYRARWGEVCPDPRSQWLEDRIKATGRLTLPALYVQGALDGVNPPAAAARVSEKFGGPFDFIELAGVGHFPQREAPERLAAHLVTFLAGRQP